MSSMIQLYDGTMIDLAKPDYTHISVEVMAHALSFINRFTGHTHTPYSVASHSVLGAIWGFPDEPDYARAYLLHDCIELCLTDVSSPLKFLLPDYKALEVLHKNAAHVAYKLGDIDETRIKEVDRRMLATEQLQLMPPNCQYHLQGYEVFPHRIPYWSTQRAEAEFITLYYRLIGE